MMRNPEITIEIAWDSDLEAYAVVSGGDEDEIHDICSEADVDTLVEDTGIGSYEYWGCRGYDSNVEVTEVTGTVTIDVSYRVTLSEADEARLEDENEDDLVEAAVAQAMEGYEWPSASTSGSVEGRRRDYDYDVSWTTTAAGRVSQVTYDAELG